MYRIFAPLLILLLLSGCKKKDIQFKMSFSSSVTIPSTFGQLVPFSLLTPEITTNAEAEFEVNNTKKDYIKSIFLNKLNLVITSPTSQSFSFLNSIDLYISADGLAEKKIAFKSSVPANVGNTLALDIIEVDIQEYIKKDKFKLRTEFVTDETIAQDVEVRIDQEFLVSAKLFKK